MLEAIAVPTARSNDVASFGEHPPGPGQLEGGPGPADAESVPSSPRGMIDASGGFAVEVRNPRDPRRGTMAALHGAMNVGRVVVQMSAAFSLALVACSSQPGTGAGGSGDEGGGCSLVGCNSSVSAALSTTVSASEVATAKVIACRNDVCSEGSLGVSNGTINGSRFYVCSFASATGINGPSCEGTSIGSLVFKFGLDDGVAKDGDRYSFKVIANGEVKGEKSGSVTYKTAQPNGPSCGPTCSQGEM